MNQHRRILSACQLPVKHYQEDIVSALSLMRYCKDTEKQAKEEKPGKLKEEDLSQILVDRLTFRSIPNHKRMRSYGASHEIEQVIESINNHKIQQAVDQELRKAQLKQQLLEILSKQNSSKETTKKQWASFSSETCWEVNTDNRHTILDILEGILRPENYSSTIARVSELSSNHYALLVRNMNFKAIYVKEDVEFSKVFGDIDCPVSIYEHMIHRKFKYQHHSLVELHKKSTEAPDVISLE